MKLFRQIALSAFVTLSSFAAITYTSCSKDACSGVTCNNGGTCSGGTCTCTTGYSGPACDTLWRTKFLKTWSATDVINSTTVVYSSTIGAGTGTDVTQILISDFSDFFAGVNTIGTVNNNTITIARQNPSSNGYYVSGTGTYAAGTISWTYTIDSNGVHTENYTGTWH